VTPELPPAALAGLSPAAAAAALGVLGLGLGTAAPLPAPLPAPQWDAFVAVAVEERLAGLLLAAVQAGYLPVTGEQRAQVERNHTAAMVHALRLERRSVQLLGVLDAAGVPTRLLKGSAFAHLDYPDPALRPFADIDVLVPGPRLDRAVAVLAEHGFVPGQAQLRPGFAARFGKGVGLVGDDGTQVDVHRTLAHGSFGLTVVLDDLWRPAATLRLGGRDVAVLDAESRLLHAAIHAVLGSRPARLLPLRDLAQVAAGGSVDPAVVLERAARWQVEPVLARAVTDAHTTLQLPASPPAGAARVLHDWALGYPVSDADRARLAAYDHPDNAYTARALDALRALPSRRDQLAYAAHLALPDREFLAAAGQTRLGWLLRGLLRGLRAAGRRAAAR
jgi:hypothetical protein